MTTHALRWLPFSTLLALAGCTCRCEGRDCGSPPTSEPDTDPCPSDDARAAPSECPAGRQIVERPAGGCPDAREHGWAHVALDSYCVYVHVGDAAAAGKAMQDIESAADSLAAFQQLVDVEPEDPLATWLPEAAIGGDCALVASAEPSAERKAMATAFDGAVISTDLVGGVPVRVAVVDTAPRERRAGAATHGRLMASIIESILAESTGAAGLASTLEVLTYPGLPRRADGSLDVVAGGFYGYQHDLGFAIHDAVADWRAHAPDSRLIINLSVGWDARLSDVGAGLVAEQLAAARCAGALIFAAVGNDHPRACPSGPAGPAFFGAYAALEPEDCAVDPRPRPTRTSTPPERPLVFPVTPVDFAGRPLDLSRANVPLAALGWNAVEESDGTLLGPMRGSSVATAVVSALAARKWSGLSVDADQLVAQLYEGGTQLGTTVDPGMAHGGWTQQRVLGWSANAPAPLVEAPSNAEPAKLVLEPHEQTCSACERQRVETVHWSSQVAQFFTTASKAWVVPQPDDVVCPTCKIDKDKLYLALANAHAGNNPPADVRVTFWSSPRVTETIHLGSLPLPLEGSNPLALTHTQLCTVDGDGSTPRAGYVEFVFSGRDATGSTYYYALGNAIDVSGRACSP